MAKRYKHNLSNYRLLTTDMGLLVPCQLQEVLPGDSIRAVSSALIRVNPLLAPVMHPVTARIHHWFVPHRLVFPQWENFITGGPDGDDQSSIPTVNTLGEVGVKSLLDYFGVHGEAGVAVNALPQYAYWKIFNEWYRDQDLVSEVSNLAATPAQCAWEKDYLTTSRPNPQKGPDITIPIQQDAPVYADGAGAGSKENYYTDADGFMFTQNGGPQMFADLSQTTATNVNDWRRAFALQRYQEARSRYGSRYSEYLKYLGVNPADSRLQRPEYLGGGKATINFSEVLQTAADDIGAEQTPVGTLRGHGIAAVRTRPFVRHFNEHGYFMSLLSVRPKTMYMNNIPRTFLRQTKEDFWQKELQQIGQQPVYVNEVYGNPATGMNTFGWQDRYADYKRTLSGTSGEFNTLLDFWHMGRNFDSPPALNGDFVQCDATKRIHSTQNEDSLWIMVSNDCRARRLVRKAGNNIIL